MSNLESEDEWHSMFIALLKNAKDIVESSLLLADSVSERDVHLSNAVEALTCCLLTARHLLAPQKQAGAQKGQRIEAHLQVSSNLELLLCLRGI